MNSTFHYLLTAHALDAHPQAEQVLDGSDE